jgi:hypothetical protein
MAKIPETLLDYLVMSGCRRVVERLVSSGTEFPKITRDLIASELANDVVDNTSLGDNDTEEGIRRAAARFVALALPDDNGGGKYQRRTLASYLDMVWMGAHVDLADGTLLGSVWKKYYAPDFATSNPKRPAPDPAPPPTHQ